MTLFHVAPGKTLGLGGGKHALSRPIGTVVVPPPPPVGGTPADIAGLAGWWDASFYAGILNTAGATATGWNTAAGGIADKSGGTRTLLPFFGAGSGTPPQATPRLNGLLGGLGRSTVVPPGAIPASGQFLPVMDNDQGLRLPAYTFGSGQPWTWMLVWSRPNWRQGYSWVATVTQPVTLLAFGSVPVVQMDSSAGSGRLILFPGASQTIISGVTLTRRHTHSLILTFAGGLGINVWLDGAQVGTGVTNAAGAGGVATLLHDTTSGGGAQCWFHEAAWWTSALSGGDITTLLSYLTRWTRGARRGITILVNGQSNAVNGYEDGAWHLMAQGVAWYLGALAWNVMGTIGSTMIGGEALYQATGDPFPGSFLHAPNDGSAPSTWGVGQDGTAAQTQVTSQSVADRADVAAIFWPWSESDSGKAYAEKATFTAAISRYAALMRGWVGKPASALPLLLWNPIPFQYFTPEPGNQMIREADYDLTQIAGANVWIALPQTSDSISRSATGNADGTWTDAHNDDIHRSASDNVRFGQRAAIVAAKAILASSGGDTIAAIPAGVPTIGGPVISHVYQQSSTVYIVTVTHDAGTDLIVPLQAANGFGWSLMDGGSVASPGTLIAATSCVYASPTKVRVTFATPATHAAGSLLLFYPYGGMNLGASGGATAIGRGLPGTSNAVTDNLSTIAPPAGWEIGDQLGSSWYANLPLAATNYGVAVAAMP
jgi:hypothetical protein